MGLLERIVIVERNQPFFSNLEASPNLGPHKKRRSNISVWGSGASCRRAARHAARHHPLTPRSHAATTDKSISGTDTQSFQFWVLIALSLTFKQQLWHPPHPTTSPKQCTPGLTQPSPRPSNPPSPSPPTPPSHPFPSSLERT